MKKTKIICSIGPASCNPDVMEKMVLAGMNVARINFSHATLEEKQGVVASVKEVRKRTSKNIAILYGFIFSLLGINKNPSLDRATLE